METLEEINTESRNGKQFRKSESIAHHIRTKNTFMFPSSSALRERQQDAMAPFNALPPGLPLQVVATTRTRT